MAISTRKVRKNSGSWRNSIEVDDQNAEGMNLMRVESEGMCEEGGEKTPVTTGCPHARLVGEAPAN